MIAPAKRDAEEGKRRMRTKRASLLTKIVVLALLVAAVTAVLDLQSQIAAAEAQKAELQAQVAAQEQTNADLQDAVDHSDDPERKEDLARSKLGLAAPDEQIIIFTD